MNATTSFGLIVEAQRKIKLIVNDYKHNARSIYYAVTANNEMYTISEDTYNSLDLPNEVEDKRK